jgi:hypothetical protein
MSQRPSGRDSVDEFGSHRLLQAAIWVVWRVSKRKSFSNISRWFPRR